MTYRSARFAFASFIALGCFIFAQPATQATTQPAMSVTISIDTSLASEFAEYGDQVKTLSETWYPKIVAALPSEGFVASDHITFVFDPKYDGVAATANDRIVCSTKYFAAHKDDLGAFVHELVHVVQHYTKGQRPGWLTEGIADYVRFFQYEPESKRPRPNAEKSKFSDSYRTTAHFLDWTQRTYDADLIVTLNKACREATYSQAIWKERTGKTLEELGIEWRQSLATTRPAKK